MKPSGLLQRKFPGLGSNAAYILQEVRAVNNDRKNTTYMIVVE